MDIVERPRVLVDVMGSDKGAAALIPGALRAFDEGYNVALIGNLGLIEENLGFSQIPVFHAATSVRMGEADGHIYDTSSSINVGMDQVRDGAAEAFISAGDTKAMVVAAMNKLLLRRNHMDADTRALLETLPTVKPGIATLIPRPQHEGMTVLMDSGAQVDCEPSDLVFFALMGAVYARQQFGNSVPRVGLLSNGEEHTKGTKKIVEANGLLRSIKTEEFEFIGNVEGGAATGGEVDVVVTDGFVGNVVLKAMEKTFKASLYGFANHMQALGPDFSAAAIDELIRYGLRFHPNSYGGAVLLGVQKGYPIISHGNSNDEAIYKSIKLAEGMAKSDLIADINRALLDFPLVPSSGKRTRQGTER